MEEIDTLVAPPIEEPKVETPVAEPVTEPTDPNAEEKVNG